MRKLYRILFTIALTVLLSPKLTISAQTANNPDVRTTSTGLTVKVAPGELLPISVKLSNFGGSKRVDVLLEYNILDLNEKSIYSSNETVAVETSNSFVKTLQIPLDTPEGSYSAVTKIIYNGQVAPATSKFTFQVEKKILGLFISDFIIYGIITVGICIVAVVIFTLLRRSKKSRFAPHDYSNIPYEQRVFYELVSDTIMAMRQKVGDKALIIAKDVNGLVIDMETGKVLKIKEKPSKVIAQLVESYEALGNNVSFSFRRNN